MGDAERKEARQGLPAATPDEAPISSGPVSQEVPRPPCVLLAGIAPGEEPTELALDRLFIQVACVSRPLLACTRIRELRPHVVIVGGKGKPLAFLLLRPAAKGIVAP